MKDFEQAVLDAERDIKAQRVAESLPQRFLQGNQIELYYGMPVLFDEYERFENIALNEIYLRARSSEFARAQGASDAKDARSWLERSPITTYEDYRSYVERSMNGGIRQLFADDTVAYILTSGSSGNPKLFAESAAGNFAKLLVMRLRGFFMRTSYPVTGDRSAKNLTFSNYACMGNAADGKPILRASGLTARNLRKYTDEMNIVPTAFWELVDIDPRTRDYVIALMALAEENLAKVFANNLAHFGRLLARIDNEADRMLRDLQTGCVPDALSPDLRERLRPLMPANRNRARDLEGVLREYGSLSSKAAICETWPRFSLVSGWLNGSTGRDARRLLRRLPRGIGTYDMGYGSSEGKWTIPQKPATAVGAASPFTAIYEFRDLRSGKLVRACDVKPQTFYELVVTTYSGLVRYNMKDVVYIDGFQGTTPSFAFCGKTSEEVRVEGRVRDSHNLQAFFAWLEQDEGVQFDLVQAFVEDGKLNFILESPHRIDYDRLLKKINSILKPHWGMTVWGIYVVDAAYEQAYFDSKEIPGRGVSGVKVPTVVENAPEARFVKSCVRLAGQREPDEG